MQKFTLSKDDDKFILHNLPPQILIQLIFNDEDEYSVFEDVYELFEFRGNKIVVKWYADNYEIEEIDDFSEIRSILRRAWKWYKSQVYIEQMHIIRVEGDMEDERFKIENQSGTSDWLITDKENLITIFFENHKFNDTQRIVELEDFTKERICNLPRILREIGEWLSKNHYDKIF